MIVFILSKNQLDGVYSLNSHHEYEDHSKPTAEDGFVRVFLAITSPYTYTYMEKLLQLNFLWCGFIIIYCQYWKAIVSPKMFHQPKK